MTDGGGPANPAEPTATVQPDRVRALALQFARRLEAVPGLGCGEGWSAEKLDQQNMLEALEAVLEFLQLLGVSPEGRKPFRDIIKLIALQDRPASRPPLKWAMVFVAIQRLIDAGMSEAEALKDVAAVLVSLRGVSNPDELLKRVKREWRKRGPLQDYTHREWSIGTAQEINRKILAGML